MCVAGIVMQSVLFCHGSCTSNFYGHVVLKSVPWLLLVTWVNLVRQLDDLVFGMVTTGPYHFKRESRFPKCRLYSYNLTPNSSLNHSVALLLKFLITLWAPDSVFIIAVVCVSLVRFNTDENVSCNFVVDGIQLPVLMLVICNSLKDTITHRHFSYMPTIQTSCE